MIRTYEVDAAQMCDALSVVPGVEHVALELDGRGRGVLRIRLAAGADGDQVVGAAVAGLRRRFGPEVDVGRLRLTGPRGCPVVAVVDDAIARPAAVDEDAPPTRAACPIGPQSTVPTPSRVAVEDVEVVTELLQVRASVRLRSGGTLHTGSATAAATASGGHRAVVSATARAVEHAAGGLVRLDVEAADVVQVGPEGVGVVVVTMVADGRLDRLTGSALVREDRSDSLVRATLDALNRRAVVASSAGVAGQW